MLDGGCSCCIGLGGEQGGAEGHAISWSGKWEGNWVKRMVME